MSFAAFGRDAGLETGAPGTEQRSLATHPHIAGPAGAAPYRENPNRYAADTRRLRPGCGTTAGNTA